MESGQIVHLGEFLIWGFLGSAALIVTLKAASGKINLKGLLRSDAESGIGAARVQLLFLTLIGAFGYLGVVVAALVRPSADLSALPPVPDAVLAVLGGGNGFYLGAKGLLTGRWLDRLRGIS